MRVRGEGPRSRHALNAWMDPSSCYRESRTRTYVIVPWLKLFLYDDGRFEPSFNNPPPMTPFGNNINIRRPTLVLAFGFWASACMSALMQFDPTSLIRTLLLSDEFRGWAHSDSLVFVYTRRSPLHRFTSPEYLVCCIDYHISIVVFTLGYVPSRSTFEKGGLRIRRRNTDSL